MQARWCAASHGAGGASNLDEASILVDGLSGEKGGRLEVVGVRRGQETQVVIV